MNYCRICLILLLATVLSGPIMANTTLDIPMNFDHWQTNFMDNWEKSEVGIMLYGQQSEMTSNKMFNFVYSQVFIKWQGLEKCQVKEQFIKSLWRLIIFMERWLQ